MGAGASLIEIRKFQEELSKKNHADDAKFWEDMMTNAPSYNRDVYLDTELVLKIEMKQPKNFMKAIELSISKCTEAGALPSGETPPDTFLNGVALSLVIFSSTVTLLADKRNGSALLAKIVKENLVANFCQAVSQCINQEAVFSRVPLKLVQALLRMMHLNYFTRFHQNPLDVNVSIPNFPGLIFVIRTCYARMNEKDDDLFFASVALLAKLGDQVWPAFAEANCQPFIATMKDARMDTFFITFLLLFIMNNPKFVDAMCDAKISNRLLMKLLRYGLGKMQSFGLNFLHSVLVSLVQVIVQNERAAIALNDAFSETDGVPPSFHGGSYGDALIEALFVLCNLDTLKESFSTIFLSISKHLNCLSLFCCMRLLDVLQIFSQEPSVSGAKNSEMILEGLATLIQKPDMDRTLAFAMARRTALFVSLKATGHDFGESLRVLSVFLNEVRSEILKSKTPVVSVEEMVNVVSSIDIRRLYKKRTEFDLRLFDFRERFGETWNEWCEVLFTQVDKYLLSLLRSHGK